MLATNSQIVEDLVSVDMSLTYPNEVIFNGSLVTGIAYSHKNWLNNGSVKDLIELRGPLAQIKQYASPSGRVEAFICL